VKKLSKGGAISADSCMDLEARKARAFWAFSFSTERAGKTEHDDKGGLLPQ